MRLIFLLFTCAACMQVFSQRTIDVNATNVNITSNNLIMMVNGEPLGSTKFTKLMEGSPYFKEEWMKGNLVGSDGKEYGAMKLRLDLFDNKVHYLDMQGQEMVATTVLQKIILFDTINQKVFDFVYSPFIQAPPAENGWYQRLADGKASLFKQYYKNMIENKPYGSGTFEQKIVTVPSYFIAYGNSFIKIKKLKDVAGALKDKTDALLKYIKDNKLSDKKEGDYISLVNYYNELVK